MIKSPCNKICKIDSENNFCISCKRTINEITNWVYLNNEEKEKIIEMIKKRTSIDKN